MNLRKSPFKKYGFLIAFCGGFIAVVIVGSWLNTKGGPTDRSPLADLIDPRNLTATLCGPDGQGHDQFFRTGFRLSLIPQAEAAEINAEAPPLWDNLGDHSYKIKTAKPKAQAYFNQGLILAYGFNHWEAIRTFREVQKIDPQCPMGYWGEAYALGPNINAPMEKEAVKPAFAAISMAQALKARASHKEQD